MIVQFVCDMIGLNGAAILFGALMTWRGVRQAIGGDE